MHHFAPDFVVSGQLVHWDKIYTDFLSKVQAGQYTPQTLHNVDYWWLLAEGAVELGARPADQSGVYRQAQGCQGQECRGRRDVRLRPGAPAFSTDVAARASL